MQKKSGRTQYSLINRRSSLLLVAALSLGGCDDAPPAAPAQTSFAPTAGSFSVADRAWIDVKDDIAPAVWLASREAGRDVAPSDPAVASFRTALAEADVRFSEGPRMIANRAVQVEAMLAERGVRESPRQVIEGLVSIGEIGERAGFGETCQHYVNARVASGSRVAALDALRGRPLPQPAGAEGR
jgi:hypothetical protein